MAEHEHEHHDQHEHGSMDITAQEQTYEAFITFVTRSVIVIVVALILLALVGA